MKNPLAKQGLTLFPNQADKILFLTLISGVNS